MEPGNKILLDQKKEVMVGEGSEKRRKRRERAQESLRMVVGSAIPDLQKSVHLDTGGISIKILL